MNAIELADAMETRASIRRQATSRKSVQENANDRLADQLEQAATMLRQQQAEIEALNKVIALITEQHDRLSKMLETSLTLNKELNTQLAGWDIEASLKKDYK